MQQSSTPGRLKKLVSAPSARISWSYDQLVAMTVQAVRDRSPPAFEIERFNRSDKRLHPLEQLTQRIDDGVQLEISCRNFWKHRSKQEVVVPSDQCHFQCGLASHEFFELHGSIMPPKPPPRMSIFLIVIVQKLSASFRVLAGLFSARDRLCRFECSLDAGSLPMVSASSKCP